MARLLFAGLWTLADREGRLEDRPKRIKASVLPYDECDANALLNELYRGGFILRYVSEACPCIQVANWHKHQAPHMKEAASQIPSYQEVTEAPEIPVLAPISHETSRPDSLLLIPDSLLLEKGAAAPPTDEPSPAETPAKVKPEEIAIPGELDTPEFRAARDAWFKQRRSKRLSLRPDYVTGQFARLLPLGSANAAACLLDTVANDYDGVFPKKFVNGPSNGKPNQPSRVGGGQRFKAT